MDKEDKLKVCKEEVTTPGVTGWFGRSGAPDKLIYIKKEATGSVDENGLKKEQEDFEILKNCEEFSTTGFRLLQCKSLPEGGHLAPVLFLNRIYLKAYHDYNRYCDSNRNCDC